MLQDLLDAMNTAASVIRDRNPDAALVIHHNDADGLSSGAVLLSALEQVGIDAAHISLEKPYPQVLEKVFADSNQLIFFADFAGKIAPYISQLNGGRNLVVILDHHPAEPSDDPMVMNLDGDLYGLKGDRDISASATCCLFAEQLLSVYKADGDPLSHLGMLGAVVDGFFVSGALSGVNRTLMQRAVKQGIVKVAASSSGETYTLMINGTEYPAETLCGYLDTLGGVGYYRNGTIMGMQLCREGITREAEEEIARLMALKDELFGRELDRIKDHIFKTRHIQWFDAQSRFEPMGIKMIGVFCTEIRDSGFLDHDAYLAGFQHIPNMVPGFGEIPFGATKISMRVSSVMTEKIRNGLMPGLDRFLPQATSRLGGFADACHSLSAATTVYIGEEAQLIDEMEKLLAQKEQLI